MLAGLKKINTKYREYVGNSVRKAAYSFFRRGRRNRPERDLSSLGRHWDRSRDWSFWIASGWTFWELELSSNVEYGIWNMGLAMYNGGVGNLLVFGDVAIVICLDGSTSSS